VRKIIVYIAMSADGYIARPDGDVGWLDRPRIAGDYGMGAFYKSIDTVLMGRKTYDIARKLGQKAYPGKKNYVFSRTRRRSRTPNVEFLNGPVGDFARELRQAKGKDIWLVGGAQLTAAFLDEGQVDEFIIHVIPTLIGEGIPLLQPRHRTVPLTLLSCRSYPDGVVRLHYSVGPQQSGH
jgi:dihydrofolate reductase